MREANFTVSAMHGDMYLFQIDLIGTKKKEMLLCKNLDQEIQESLLQLIFGVEVLMSNKCHWSLIMIYLITENFTFIELVDQDVLEEKVWLSILSNKKM
jgi:hypothetical protein